MTTTGDPVVEHSVRSRAVDVFRGATLMYLGVLVLTPTTGWGGHAEWFGWRPDDAFFPAFLLISGVGLAHQTHQRLPWPRLLRRFIALVVLGLLLNAWLGSGADLSTLRIPGVLQRIAIVGLAGAGIVAVLQRSWRSVAVAAAVITIAWGGLLAQSARSCPGDEATRDGCGTFLWLDERAFGGADHVYRAGTAGHDPEGIASTLGAVATFLAGFAAGGLAFERRERSLRVRAGALVAMAAGWLVVTPLATAFAPFGKRLWTPSFVTLNAAAGIALLALLMLVFDATYRQPPAPATRSAVAFPFEAFGRNTLVLYITLSVVERVLEVTSVSDGTMLGPHLVEVYGPVGYFVILGGAWLAMASVMHAVKWHVRL